MITTLHVESFKTLADVTLPLGHINLLIGANGCGKSNILEAIGVLGAAASGRVDDESLLRRGVRPGVPALYKSSFRGVRTNTMIRFTAQGGDKAETARYAVGLWNPLTDPKPAWRYHTETLEDVEGRSVGRSPASKSTSHNPEAGLAALKLVDLKPNRPSALLLRLLQDYVIYTPTTAALRGLAPDFQREPVGLSGGRLPEAVTELLQLSLAKEAHREFYQKVCGGVLDLIDWANMYGSGLPSPDVLSPSVPSARRILRFRDRYMAEKRNILTGYDASEGALYVLLAAVLSAHPNAPSAFAIDNFDHGLNPRLARALIERFCNWALHAPSQRQVILTTHNPLVLDGLDLKDDRVRLFAVDRTEKGRTAVQRVVVDDEMLEKAKQGWTLSRLWIMGLLGGVPDV